LGCVLFNKRKDYDKNICRYIARQIIRSFVSEDFEKEVYSLCGKNPKTYKETTKFFLNKIEYVSGHRVLKDLLTLYRDDPEELKQKKKLSLENSVNGS